MINQENTKDYRTPWDVWIIQDRESGNRYIQAWELNRGGCIDGEIFLTDNPLLAEAWADYEAAENAAKWILAACPHRFSIVEAAIETEDYGKPWVHARGDEIELIAKKLTQWVLACRPSNLEIDVLLEHALAHSAVLGSLDPRPPEHRSEIIRMLNEGLYDIGYVVVIYSSEEDLHELRREGARVVRDEHLTPLVHRLLQEELKLIREELRDIEGANPDYWEIIDLENGTMVLQSVKANIALQFDAQPREIAECVSRMLACQASLTGILKCGQRRDLVWDQTVRRYPPDHNWDLEKASNPTLAEFIQALRDLEHHWTVFPPEPPCLDGTHHEWRDPDDLVQGLSEDVGCYETEEELRTTEVCAYCGRYRVMHDRNLNVTIEFLEADHTSLEWIGRGNRNFQSP